MNSLNSSGFLVVGAAMVMMPMLAPEGFPPTGFDGTSARALWLEIVGGAQMAIAVASLLQIWVPRLAERLPTLRLPLLDRSPAPTRLPSGRMIFE